MKNNLLHSIGKSTGESLFPEWPENDDDAMLDVTYRHPDAIPKESRTQTVCEEDCDGRNLHMIESLTVLKRKWFGICVEIVRERSAGGGDCGELYCINLCIPEDVIISHAGVLRCEMFSSTSETLSELLDDAQRYIEQDRKASADEVHRQIMALLTAA